jgi:hypothetical protein
VFHHRSSDISYRSIDWGLPKKLARRTTNAQLSTRIPLRLPFFAKESLDFGLVLQFATVCRPGKPASFASPSEFSVISADLLAKAGMYR